MKGGVAKVFTMATPPNSLIKCPNSVKNHVWDVNHSIRTWLPT